MSARSLLTSWKVSLEFLAQRSRALLSSKRTLPVFRPLGCSDLRLRQTDGDILVRNRLIDPTMRGIRGDINRGYLRNVCQDDLLAGSRKCLSKFHLIDCGLSECLPIIDYLETRGCREGFEEERDIPGSPTIERTVSWRANDSPGYFCIIFPVLFHQFSLASRHWLSLSLLVSSSLRTIKIARMRLGDDQVSRRIVIRTSSSSNRPRANVDRDLRP